jgi:hypothetical protein
MKLLVLAAALSVTLPARATVLVPLDTQGLTERADRVVLGIVEAQESRWSPDHSVIFTEAKVRVTKSYKGAAQPGDVILVRREGGSAGGIGMRVSGAATFTVGEELLVFLEQRGTITWTVGMTQGKLSVVTGSDGIKRVAPNLAGVAWEHAPDAKARAAMVPRRLDDVEREIQGFARGAK